LSKEQNVNSEITLHSISHLNTDAYQIIHAQFKGSGSCWGC